MGKEPGSGAIPEIQQPHSCPGVVSWVTIERYMLQVRDKIGEALIRIEKPICRLCPLSTQSIYAHAFHQGTYQEDEDDGDDGLRHAFAGLLDLVLVLLVHHEDEPADQQPVARRQQHRRSDQTCS